MTAIAAAAGSGPASTHAVRVRRMLDVMRARGSDRNDCSHDDSMALGVAWYDWEAGLTPALPAGVARRGPLMLAADASLYYRDDLRRAIAARGVQAPSDGAAALILAAYEAFGDSCLDHLEGDFAFALWDAQRGRLLAARDFGGLRPLFYSDHGAAVAIASTISGVLADDRIPRDLNLASIATSASGLWTHTTESCYGAVSELGAGCMFTWERGKGAAVSRFWRPPSELARDPGSMDAAAEQLLALLTRATEERMEHDRPTGITLSGGWDSPAIFGAGQHAIKQARAMSHGTSRVPSWELRPVSISYPEGDPGREDELIADIVSFWETSTQWIDIGDIPMFGQDRVRARERDDPFAHPYEEWNRRLCRAARESGARVVLNGSGGDQLFQVSDVFMADLLRSGHWIDLMKQWRARGGRGSREFLRWAVRPALSDRTLRLLARVRGAGPPHHYLDRTPAFWFNDAFLHEHAVMERERRAMPALPRTSLVVAETHAYLLFPYFSRITARVASFALEEGVELRSPLLDARIVDFAVGRPWYERTNGAETKLLLRRSMRGLLPDRHLAPRTHRTGLTSGYLKRSLQGPGRPLVEEMVQDPILASVGMIDAAKLRRAWTHYLQTGAEQVGVNVYFTIQAELWLREHQDAILPGAGAPERAAPAGLA